MQNSSNLQKNGLSHTRHRVPKSNGLAEHTIQTLKKVLKKARREGTDPNLAILELCNTPRNNDLGSPAQPLFSRRTKTLLPVSDQLLKPIVVENVTTNLKNERDRQKRYYNQHTTSLPQIKQRRPRHGKNSPKANWQSAKVKKEIAPRSYLITDNNDTVLIKAKSITFDENSRTKFRKLGDKVNSYVW
jgi:hypothetical protein